MATILLAEDEHDIRDLLTITLQLGGHDVTAKKNGAEVVEVVEEIMPDLILLDVRMPRMTGYEACKAVKANDKTKHVPVVFLSAKGQEAEVQTGLDAGAVDYILKPFAPDLLLSRVSEILKELQVGDVKPTKQAKNHIPQMPPPPPPSGSDQTPAKGEPSTTDDGEEKKKSSYKERLARFKRPPKKKK